MEQTGTPVLPLDSELSAIFQCLKGNEACPPEEILLTASGGPFRTWPVEDIKSATLEQALRHPNWSMGAKITIDSATMANKGLEVMETRWMFDVPPEKITVVVHPESIVHSAVRFADNSVMAQMGVADMKLPIAYALSHPGGGRMPWSGWIRSRLARCILSSRIWPSFHAWRWRWRRPEAMDPPR